MVEADQDPNGSHEGDSLRELKLACMQNLLSSTDERVYFKDLQSRFLLVSEGWVAAVTPGRRVEEVIGRTDFDFFAEEHAAAAFADEQQIIASGVPIVGKLERETFRDRTGPWVSTTKMPLRDDSGRIIGTFGISRDVTAQITAENALAYQVLHDPVTGLANRIALMDRLSQALVALERRPGRLALLYVDLDHFKAINDSFGHAAGDQVLTEVGRRLSHLSRHVDTVARLGGDEFVVLLEELSENLGEAAAQTEEIAERALSALGSPYTIAGRAHDSTASIGVTLFIDAVDSLDELLKQADIAMYQAKSAGRNALRFFDPGMQGALAARTALEAALRLAIRDRQFVLHYQPQVDGAGRFIGAEALLRWRCPERGLVAPGEFIPLAEETGLILPIGQWVLEAACSQLVDWADDPRARELPLSINVSARQFRQPDFVDQVRRTLERAGAPAAKLKLELTESLVIDDVEGTIEKMRALKRLGVGFSMDDFGTGYSSLSYLTRLPLDQIKIDRSFVRNLPDSANDAAVSQTIITLAKSLGLAVIAEGVETEAQRRFLASQGCPTYQGFLFSPPVDIALFERLLG